MYFGVVEGRLCLLDVLELKEVMRRVLHRMLQDVEGGLCLLEALEVAIHGTYFRLLVGVVVVVCKRLSISCVMQC